MPNLQAKKFPIAHLRSDAELSVLLENLIDSSANHLTPNISRLDIEDYYSYLIGRLDPYIEYLHSKPGKNAQDRRSYLVKLLNLSNECVREIGINHFLKASEKVMGPVYAKYRLKAKDLRRK
jgi:hypothetical protein